jgi:chlorophyllide a reductase subunit Y
MRFEGDLATEKPLPFRGGVGEGDVQRARDIVSLDQTSPTPNPSPEGEGLSCSNRDELKTAAVRAGKADILAGFERDYPKGPHDQPQSMCPAFGSLRVGLRMRRTATILSGSPAVCTA